MFDVPKIEGFMSNVGCEKCHMPATRADFADVGLERYADRSYKRYSHAMRIVEPGQFASQPWQDSCSPCHPGLGQDELTTYIEDLQDTGAELLAETSAAILAADARIDYTGSATPSANKALLDRAFTNYSFANGEGSGGFHNPGYTQAGLRRAVQMADSVSGHFAHVQTSSSLAFGGLGFVAGAVENGRGAVAAGEDITLIRDGVAYGFTKSDANGNFAFTIAGDGAHTYKVVWERCGDPIADLASAQAYVPVVKRPSSTSLSRSVSSMRRGGTVILSGTVAPSASGQSIRIQYRRTTTAGWRTLRTITLDGANNYRYGFSTRTTGYWYFRTVYSGSPTTKASTSRTVRVLVTN
jgi:hypothetical protein